MPEIDPRIRPAKPTDLDAICGLNAQVHAIHRAENPLRYRELDPTDIRLRAHHLAAMEDDEALLLVSCDEAGWVVGYVLAKWRNVQDSPFLNDALELHVDQLVVDSEHRGQGHGCGLLRKVMASARGLGADRLSLGVAVFNERARKLFEREGFQVLGRVMVRRA